MRAVPGRAIQRRFEAPSDQKAALTSYSMTPGAGTSSAVFSNRPVSERNWGKVPVGVEEFSSKR